MRKGSYFFVIDAFIAGIIITGAIVVLYSQFLSGGSEQQAFYTAEDFLRVLESTRVSEIDNDRIRQWRENGTINDSSRTVLQQLAYFNVTGQQVEMGQLAQVMVGWTPDNVGTSLLVADGTAATKNEQQRDEADTFFTSKRIALVRQEPPDLFSPVVVEVQTWQ